MNLAMGITILVVLLFYAVSKIYGLKFNGN